MKACPYRKAFFEKLAADPDGGEAVAPEKLDEEFNKWLAALAAIVARLQKFYQEGGYSKGF